MLLWLLAALLVATAAGATAAVAATDSLHADDPGYGEKKVDVDLFVMSKCP
jgi:hypothetical protein